MRFPVIDILLVAAVIAVAMVVGTGWYWRRWVRRTARRAHRRFGARIDRFKLTGKRYITEALLDDPDVAAAVRAHAAEHGMAGARRCGDGCASTSARSFRHSRS